MKNSDSPALDYIIIGGGTAGCVRAHLFTERGDVRVLPPAACGDPSDGPTL